MKSVHNSPTGAANSPAKRVLIVDDSATVLEYLKHVINADAGLEVAGTARSGHEALEMVKLERPDIVTMDIHMPGMDGLEATRRIMEECPTPIVIVTSSWDQDQIRNSFRAIEAGALAALEKPHGPGHPKSAAMVVKLLEMLKTMAEVRVVRRYHKHREKQNLSPKDAARLVPPPPRTAIELVAIGASTGGPPAIRAILGALDRNYPIPLVIVQHIATGFLRAMVDWLNAECEISVVIARNGEIARAGHAYFAPEGLQMGVNRGGSIVLTDSPAENGLKPAVSYLFRSVAKAYGPRALGILLTGMGRDGAAELKGMRDRGAITIAQSKESCVVYGMPAEAVKLDAAERILSPEEMVTFLISMTGKSAHPPGVS